MASPSDVDGGSKWGPRVQVAKKPVRAIARLGRPSRACWPVGQFG